MKYTIYIYFFMFLTAPLMGSQAKTDILSSLATKPGKRYSKIFADVKKEIDQLEKQKKAYEDENWVLLKIQNDHNLMSSNKTLPNHDAPTDCMFTTCWITNHITQTNVIPKRLMRIHKYQPKKFTFLSKINKKPNAKYREWHGHNIRKFNELFSNQPAHVLYAVLFLDEKTMANERNPYYHHAFVIEKRSGKKKSWWRIYQSHYNEFSLWHWLTELDDLNSDDEDFARQDKYGKAKKLTRKELKGFLKHPICCWARFWPNNTYYIAAFDLKKPKAVAEVAS